MPASAAGFAEPRRAPRLALSAVIFPFDARRQRCARMRRCARSCARDAEARRLLFFFAFDRYFSFLATRAAMSAASSRPQRAARCQPCYAAPLPAEMRRPRLPRENARRFPAQRAFFDDAARRRHAQRRYRVKDAHAAAVSSFRRDAAAASLMPLPHANGNAKTRCLPLSSMPFR